MKLITLLTAVSATFLSTFASQAHDVLPACTQEQKTEYWLNYSLSNIPGEVGFSARQKSNNIASTCDIYGQ